LCSCCDEMRSGYHCGWVRYKLGSYEYYFTGSQNARNDVLYAHFREYPENTKERNPAEVLACRRVHELVCSALSWRAECLRWIVALSYLILSDAWERLYRWLASRHDIRQLLDSLRHRRKADRGRSRKPLLNRPGGDTTADANWRSLSQSASE
jgi:hypothetical protein